MAIKPSSAQQQPFEALSPVQQHTFESLSRALPIGSVFVLSGDDGMGKTRVLRALHRERGGALVTIREFLDAMRDRHPFALEEAFEQCVRDALERNDLVLVDDLCLLGNVTSVPFYPRSHYLDAVLIALADRASEAGKKLVFGNGGCPVSELEMRGYAFAIDAFGAEDYRQICTACLDPGPALDYERIHRFAPQLNAHQLRSACEWLKTEPELDTERFLDYLRSQRMSSNVDLGEVQAVDLHDLQGIDDVIESLEANVIVPLENDALAAALDLQPQRGILLVGPPGTGKTTIGRALAHRLKSKFFLIDGTFIAGTEHFYTRVGRLFEAAEQNAPSILFIDDSDAIFESGEELGLYRYLLTMLDGLESKRAGQVCVILTAMDVAGLPPALLRSGRIELWLEIRPPDDTARAAILRQHLDRLPPLFSAVEVDRLISATEGFTGADLKRLTGEGKSLYAYDLARGLEPAPLTDYFLRAIENVRSNKERYAEAEAASRLPKPKPSRRRFPFPH